MKFLTALTLYAFACASHAQLNPTTMPKVGTVDPRFQSYNIETVEVVGGRFWKPYGPKKAEAPKGDVGAVGIDPNLYEKRTPVDLADPRLRKLAKALAPHTCEFPDRG